MIEVRGPVGESLYFCEEADTPPEGLDLTGCTLIVNGVPQEQTDGQADGGGT